MAKDNFSDLGRVDAIAQLYEGTGYVPFQNVDFKVSDKSSCVNATKLLLEGIDFDLVYFPLKHLGYKSVLAVTGELYAALARPRSLGVTIGISAKLDFTHIRSVWEGVVTAAKEHGYGSVSLDLVPSRNGLCFALGAAGEISEALKKKKSPAQSMDLICVSDNLGAAYLGFEILEKEKRAFEKMGKDAKQPDLEEYKNFVGAYLKPSINPAIISQLTESDIVPSHGYFVTRGLADTVKRLVRDSGLGAKIYVDRIPFAGGSFDVGKKLNIDPMTAVLNGGDDYRLLYTVPIGKHDTFRHDFQVMDIIGHLAKPEVGAVLVTPDGVELPLHAQGWNNEQ